MARTGSRLISAIASSLVALCIAAAPTLAQLQPPPGPVSTSMKRLDQVEPRTCVNSLPGSQTAVHVISAPGNYVLTGDVLGSDRKSGIQITCDGHVSLDLNGFSITGVPGSLHGVHHTGGSGSPDTRRSFVMPHMLEVRGRISSWGGDGLSLNNLDVCDVDGLLIEDCGGAACRIVSHDGSRNNVRHFISRGCAGGGIVASMMSSSGGGAGKASFSDLHFTSCGGNAIHVICPSSSSVEIDIRSSSSSNCSGHGVCIEAVAGGVVGGGAGKVSMQDLSITGCVGNGIRCVCAPGWQASCTIDRCIVSGCSADGVHVVGAEVCSVGGLSCTDCVGAGLFVSSDPSSEPSGALLLYLSKKGYDYYAARCDVGLHATRLQHVSLSGVRCTSCVDTGILCEDIALCDISSCDVSSCGGDGVSVKRVVKFKAGSDLAGSVNKGSSIVACGGSGISIQDCPDASCSSLRISLCLGDGISHSWTSPPETILIAHEHVHVIQSRSGLVISCPSSSVSLDLSCSSSSFSSNTGAGVSVTCPSSSSVRCDFSSSSSSNNGSSGVELVCHPSSSVQFSCSHLRCVHNGGAGLLCVSSDPASSLSRGSLHLDSSVCSSNTGAGCRCACPLVGDRCVFSENGSSGVEVFVASPFESAGSLSSCTLHRNAVHGFDCARGRYAHVLCDASDNGSHGMRCGEGCLIVESCVCNGNGGDGLHVTGTLNVSGGAMRRNGGGGVRCSSGVCVMTECVCELNGTNPGVTGGGALFVNCSSVSLHRCVCNNNTGPGVSSSSSSGVVCSFTAADCTCSSNSSSGMSLHHCVSSQVLRCVFSSNSVWGLECPQSFSSGKIDSCSCVGNGGGILVQGQNNLVIANTCSFGPIGALSVAQGNAVGRIVDQASLTSGACDGRSNLVH